MATLREMLDKQERIFRNIFETLSFVNIRIDEVLKSVAEIKASLQYSLQEVDDLMESTDSLADIEHELEDIQKSLKDREDKIKFLGNQRRRKDNRVNGIPDDDHETWSSTETKVKP